MLCDEDQELEVTDVNDEAPEIGDESQLKKQELESTMVDQDDEAVEMATRFLLSVVRLRGVKIDRLRFLTTELHRSGVSPELIAQTVAHGPAKAGVEPEIIDEVAERVIRFETRKSTAASFATGMPGGLAMIGTVPADVTQFYAHAFRIMQKLAYVYGWHDFIKDTENVDDETLGILASFLGIMMGASGAANALNSILQTAVKPAVQRNIAKKALTKTIWYPVLKKTLKFIGINVTKQSLAKSVAKAVPIVGGIVSGGITHATLTGQSSRLKDHLEELAPPMVDIEDMAAQVSLILAAAEDDQRWGETGRKKARHMLSSIKERVSTDKSE